MKPRPERAKCTPLPSGAKWPRSVCGRQVKNDYRVGVAEQRKDLGLVMFELALPMPAEGPDHLRLHLLQVDEILKFTKEGEANG